MSGRLTKQGLDYFAFDIDFFNDEKIEFVSARFGIKGEIIAIRLLCKIYRNGYYTCWNEDESTLLAKRAGDGFSPSLVSEIVNELVKRGFFEQTLLNRFGILTSAGIQRRYVTATRERKGIEINGNYWLLELPKNASSSINKPINSISPAINSINRPINSQSKVKESKRNNPSIISPRGDEQGLSPELKNQESKSVDKSIPKPTPELRGTPSPDFVKFQEWIKNNAPRVAKMKEPFSEAQFVALKKNFDSNFICNVLRDMHNHEPLLKKNHSAYLTLLNWAKRRNNGASPNVERSRHAIANYDGNKFFEKF